MRFSERQSIVDSRVLHGWASSQKLKSSVVQACLNAAAKRAVAHVADAGHIAHDDVEYFDLAFICHATK